MAGRDREIRVFAETTNSILAIVETTNSILAIVETSLISSTQVSIGTTA